MDAHGKKLAIIVIIQIVLLITVIYQYNLLSALRSQYAKDQKHNLAYMKQVTEFIQQYNDGQKEYRKYLEIYQLQMEEYNKLQEIYKLQEEKNYREMEKYNQLRQNVEDRLKKISDK